MTEEGEGKVKSFIPSKGITTVEAHRLLEQWGRNELSEKKKSKVIIVLVMSLRCA